MFGKASKPAVARSQSLIQEGVTIRGEIRADGDLRLEGSLEGSLVAQAKVIIGATGTVHADVEADEVLVMGRVVGRITGRRRVELRKGAYVEGDLATQSLVIEEGVFFQGLCQMQTAEPEVEAARGATPGSPSTGFSSTSSSPYPESEDEELFGRSGTKSSN